MSNDQLAGMDFQDLSLSAPVLEALKHIGYETPSPIQASIIPLFLKGKDVVGQAQTGTGKTAAFALPVLSKITIDDNKLQALVLTPTRELAIQVAEAFQSYASKIDNFHVLPVYGGQNYSHQLKQLKRGVHVVVGTPGRVMDHIRRGTLRLDNISCLVLDEADEMLRMGFIDDVEWILDKLPEQRQTALLSATMPKEIRNIARKYLQNPEEITIKAKTVTAESIRQRYWSGPGALKLDVLTRILEFEPFDAAIVFVRTRQATTELAEKLEARGYAAAALNGDIAQNQRERIVDRYKKGRLDILVATDVAARGLDVDRITHVINYDIPYDTEAYTHRIGRTGRAGRKGEAILMITPREKRLLSSIERATKQPIELMEMPSTSAINEQRVEKFKEKITLALQSETGLFLDIINSYQKETGADPCEIAAALAKIAQGRKPLLLKELPKPAREDSKAGGKREKSRRAEHEKPEKGMSRFRIEAGRSHGVKPGNIVGAIANEADLESRHIGPIRIMDNYSLVDLPSSLSSAVIKHLARARVAGRPMNISRLQKSAPSHTKKPTGQGKASGKKSREKRNRS